MKDKAYDFLGCSSRFDYAMKVHSRSGGICQLCGCGKSSPDFDLWRQLTVEHLIGQGQDGYLTDIRTAIKARFPELPTRQQASLADELDAANTITACAFCNSTTSHAQAPHSMSMLIETTAGGPADLVAAVKEETASILE